MIKLEGISKSLGNTIVLRDVNLEIKDNTVFGLVGVNGAGKSTLLRLMAGIYDKDNGSILYDGKEVYENEEVKKDIFLISDDVYYPLNATINSLRAFYASIYPLDEKMFAKYLNIFNLDPTKEIRNFSKGMKRQAFILLALAIKPKYLLLDEAFDGLDPLMRLTFKQAISDLLLDENITVIISSHNLRELEDICDSYGIIFDHTIHASGDIQDSKMKICKVQMAIANFDKELLKPLHMIKCSQNGQVYNMIFKNDKEEVLKYLSAFEPIFIEALNVSFEELFIYEMYERGYIHEW